MTGRNWPCSRSLVNIISLLFWTTTSPHDPSITPPLLIITTHHPPPTTATTTDTKHRNRYAWAWGEKEGRIGFDLRYFTAWNYTTLLIVFVLLSFQHIFTYTPQWVSNVTWTLFQVRFRSVLIMISPRYCVDIDPASVLCSPCCCCCGYGWL
jgi:hypothetical protein